MNREQLLATLTETTQHAVAWDEYRYVDWSTRTGDHYLLEVGDADDAVRLELTRAELAELHQQLTLTLLADPETT